MLRQLKNLVKCCTSVEKIAFEKACNRLHDLQGHSESSEMARFNRAHITSY